MAVFRRCAMPLVNKRQKYYYNLLFSIVYYSSLVSIVTFGMLKGFVRADTKVPFDYLRIWIWIMVTGDM